MNKNRSEIKEIMKSVFEMKVINDDISQSSCDNWDSLRLLNLVIQLEEKFKIEFKPEEIIEMNSLVAIENIITKIMGE